MGLRERGHEVAGFVQRGVGGELAEEVRRAGLVVSDKLEGVPFVPGSDSWAALVADEPGFCWRFRLRRRSIFAMAMRPGRNGLCGASAHSPMDGIRRCAFSLGFRRLWHPAREVCVCADLCERTAISTAGPGTKNGGGAGVPWESFRTGGGGANRGSVRGGGVCVASSRGGLSGLRLRRPETLLPESMM